MSPGPSTPVASPIVVRTSHVPSPSYQIHIRDHKRHSLYGTDDRIVLDPGSRIWKVGFSAEHRPRACFWSGQQPTGEVPSTEAIWEVEFESVGKKDRFGEVDDWDVEHQIRDQDNAPNRQEEGLRELGESIVERRIGDRLREVFSNHLMTDPKSRRMIIAENPLLPTRIKEMLARSLFEDFQVPSISFVPPHLLALLAVGRTSGLVIDVGNLEIVALPIQLSRPLYTHLRSSSLASAHIRRTLALLLLHFGQYIPPISTLSQGSSSRMVRTPRLRLTPSILRRKGLLERVLSEGCFVGRLDREVRNPQLDEEAENSRMDTDEITETQELLPQEDPEGQKTDNGYAPPPLPRSLRMLHNRYANSSNVKTLFVPIPTLPGEGIASGTLVIPGWIRERVVEELFSYRKTGENHGEVEEERGVVDVILECLMKLPIDLRIPMASSILLTGGTPMLPNFIPRLRSTLLAALEPPPSINPSSLTESQPNSRPGSYAYIRRPMHPYASVISLRQHISIINNASLVSSSSSSSSAILQTSVALDSTPAQHMISSPDFSPSLLAWIGGSLTGCLKISAKREIGREKWDEGREGRRKIWKEAGLLKRDRGDEDRIESEDEDDYDEVKAEAEWKSSFGRKGGVEVLGDWTRVVYGTDR
ncbi:Actin and related proteins [Phaffia rhodozyma]|uniref:Actin and related proteins n=1 Tax=Phaffia rhodozyma TaxID=264483 RepID=A0A0F7SMC0_PHARH|nr:Actin and related proteins [Phaffia rhodozyma]